jgi:hypothetical protein
MLGWGVQYWGIDYWGSVGPSEIATLFGEFNFTVVPKPEGYAIKITLTTPESADSPAWNRRFRILRKQNEWPQNPFDTDVEVITDEVEPGQVDKEYFDTGLISNEIYYYALFLQDTQDQWLSTRVHKGSAYPFDRWGMGDYIYESLPRGWRTADTSLDLKNFCQIIGATADDLKTDAEHLQSMFTIEEVHEELLPVADSKVGWPTWVVAGGIQKRQDSISAVDTYKVIGTEIGYKQLVETSTDWQLTVAQGWRYLLWTNSVECTTPDLTDPLIRKDIGGFEDTLKYLNDPAKWQSLTGLGFYLTEIPGITGPLTQTMWNRVLELLEWGKACYVVYQVKVVPITEEQYLANWIVDESPFPLVSYSDSISIVQDEELFPWSETLDLFMTNTSASITNDASDRMFHEYLSFGHVFWGDVDSPASVDANSTTHQVDPDICLYDGYIIRIRLYCNANGFVKVQIYEASGGVPTNLLWADDSGLLQVSIGLNDIIVSSPVQVFAGNEYCIGAIPSTRGAVGLRSAGGEIRYTSNSQPYSTFIAPSVISGYSSDPSYRISGAAIGVIALP